MGLYRGEYDHSFEEYNFEEQLEDMKQKKKIRRMLEDRLERRRLKEECKDDLDEYEAEFDWDDLER